MSNVVWFRSWYPCEHPERIPDAFTNWHTTGCVGCCVAYEAQQFPPPAGAFDGWHRRWSADVLAAMRTGDIEALERAMSDIA